MPYVPSLEELVARAKANVGAERARLRDEFAMAALQGLIQDQHASFAKIAADAYAAADAMLAARDTPEHAGL